MPSRIFGPISEIAVGSWFPSRIALSRAGVHRPTQAGIAGSAHEGADSIVLSGGYEDDVDAGDIIFYTGEGGRDPGTGQQVRAQTLTRGNLALAKSCLHGLPVRVSRKIVNADGEHGYRYDGLYRVEAYWREAGQSGFDIWRYKLLRIKEVAHEGVAESSASYEPAPRIQTYTTRIVRETALARTVKQWYAFRCQACGETLETAAGSYAEAAHIRPLGTPHNGPDELANMLCLCPNHHVLFDAGGFALHDDLRMIGLPGTLITLPRHRIAQAHVHYHRALWYPE